MPITFDVLRQHCIDEGCNFTLLQDNVYLVKNCINGECCIVEDIDFYSTPYLAHIFYELNIAPHPDIEDFIHIYYTFRNNQIESIEVDE